MRSRFACLFGLLFSNILLASHASAQIQFASSTLELKPADEPAATQPITPIEPAASDHAAAKPGDSAPASSAAPNDSTEHQATSDSTRPVNHLPTVVEPQYKPHSRPLVNPYTSASARAAMSKMPQPMQVQAAQMSPSRHPARPQGKPFQASNSEPAISPYLSLYQNNSNQNVLLNYYTVVRPQMDQIEANKKQEAEIQKLRSQVQNSSSGGVRQASFNDGSSSEGMTVSAHYMDTAQFYQQQHKRK
jgi:hypothetical protein